MMKRVVHSFSIPLEVGPRRTTLNEGQREHAREAGVTEAEYATAIETSRRVVRIVTTAYGPVPLTAAELGYCAEAGASPETYAENKAVWLRAKGAK